MRRADLIRAGSAIVAGGAAGMILGPVPAARARPAIPNVPVIDQFGRARSFYDHLVRDRMVLVNIFYTSCGATCPLVTQNLREVQDLLGARMGRDIFILSVSLQPELETPDVLRGYAAQWEARPGWSFLTGRPADIERLRRGLGFASADPDYDRDKDSHTGMVRYGNDRLDRWASTAGLGRPVWIAKAATALADMG